MLFNQKDKDITTYDYPRRRPFQGMPTTLDNTRFGICYNSLILRNIGTLAGQRGNPELYPNSINKGSGRAIPEGCMSTIRKHNNGRVLRQRTIEGTIQQDNEDRNAPITAGENQQLTADIVFYKATYNQSTTSPKSSTSPIHSERSDQHHR